MGEAIYSEEIECLPALFYQYPELAEKLPWISLRGSELEEPPRRLHRSQHLWGENYFFVKEEAERVDLLTESVARRWEFVFGELEARGIKRLIIFDELGSTRPLSLAQACSYVGLPLELHLFGKPQERLADTPAAYGAKMTFHSRRQSFNWSKRFQQSISGLRSSVIYPQEDLAVLESIGYMNALYELHAQVKQGQVPDFDVLLVPVRTASAYLGFEMARRALQWDSLSILGLSRGGVETSRPDLSKMALALKSKMESSSSNIKMSVPSSPEDWKIFQLDQSKIEAGSSTRLMRRMLELESWELDLRSEADLLAGALNWLSAENVSGRKILFWSFSSQPRLPVIVPELDPRKFRRKKKA